MKHPHWSEIYDYFKEVDQQKAKLESRKNLTDSLSTARNSLVISIKQVKNNLKQSLDELSVHHIIFALISLLDEEMKQLITSFNQQGEWVPLQKEFFDLTNAGEVFFDYLDEALENPQFSSIVFEVFYFVLKKGFRGKYQLSLIRISKYMDLLSEKIHQPALAKERKSAPQVFTLPKIRIKIWQYYAGSLLLIMCVYTILVIRTNLP